MNSILLVSLRIGGIVLAVQFFKEFPSLYLSYREGVATAINANYFWIFHFMPSFFLLASSAIMWFLPHYLIKNLSFPRVVEDSSIIDPKRLHYFLISIIAIYILINSVDSIIYNITLHLSLQKELGNVYKLQANVKAGLISSFATSLMGGFLLVKSKYISDRLDKLIVSSSN